jgi:gamma-glutamyltranspeptidase / glutathione hydrolase
MPSFPFFAVHLLTFTAFTMRISAFTLPGILLSQLTEASPAWLKSDYDVSARTSDPGHDKLGAVASESSICSHIGINILKKGGNAADSLVATVFCIGVIGMYHRLVYHAFGSQSKLTRRCSGIGGGGFMLVRSSDGKFEDIDFREMAPAAAFTDMYNKNVVSSS